MKRHYFTLLILVFLARISFSQCGWFQQQSGITNNFFDSYFINANTGWMVGSETTILKTTNGGNNWVSQSLSMTQFTFTGVYFINSLTGWVCGGNPYPYNILVKTIDGGNSWMLETPSINYLLWGIFFINSQTGWSCGWNGTIMKTTNGGTNWVNQYSGTTNELYRVQFTDVNTGYITGTYGDIIKTTNGGTNWSHIPLGTTTWLRWVHFPASSTSLTGWVTGNNGLILKTTNAGINWITQYSGVSSNLGAVFFVNNLTGWVVGSNGTPNATVLKTINGGINWTLQSIGVSANFSTVFFTNSNTGWISGYSGIIYKTTNAGQTLPPAPILLSPPDYSTDVSLTPNLEWNSVPEVLNYKVQVSTVPNFTVIKDSAVLTGTQYTVPSGKLNYATTYFWRVNATNLVGTGPWSNIWLFSTIISSGIRIYESAIPDNFKLYNNFPNPFNPVTKIRFEIPYTTNVSIKIFNNLGSEIVEVANGLLKAGKYEFTLNASKLTSGVYYCRLNTKDYVETKRMMLIK